MRLGQIPGRLKQIFRDLLPMSTAVPGRCANIVMFHIGRSGSQVLGDLLNQHSEIHWDHEVYVKQLQATRKQGLSHVSGDPIALLREKMAYAENKFYGMEVKFFHLQLYGISLPDYIVQLKRLGFTHFIVLERKNYLRKIVSSLIAHQTAKWHQPVQRQATLSRIVIDVDDVRIDWSRKPLRHHLIEYQQNFISLHTTLYDCNVLNLTYEDHIWSDPLTGYQRCCQFLSIPPEPVAVRFSQSNPFSLADMIINFEEVEQTLQGTQFEWMLYS